MNSSFASRTLRSLAVPAVLGLALAGLPSMASASTILYSENFDGFGSSQPLSAYGWSSFASDGDNTNNIAITGSGSTLAHEGNRQLYLQLNSSTISTSAWWSAGVIHSFTGSLTTTDLSRVSLSANVWGGGSVGPVGDVQLRIQSSTGNWLGFNLDGATLAANPGMTLGGALSGANASAGTFDASASSFSIYFTFLNPQSTWGYDTSNIIWLDNVTLAVGAAVPEPSTFAIAAGTLGLFAAVFRRRRSVR